MWAAWNRKRIYVSVRLYSTVIKNKKKQVKQSQESIKQPHAFQSLYPWKTKRSLAEHLVQNVVHKEDGIIAINKPYGVPLRHSGPVGKNESLFSIEDCLKDMEEILQLGPIKPSKLAERFTSGVSILTYSDKADEKIQKSYQINRSTKAPTFSYWAITMGPPVPEKQPLQKVGLAWLTVKETDFKLATVVENFSKKSVLDGEVHPLEVTHHIIGKSQQEVDYIQPCLVEISVQSAKHHFLRIYLSHQVSPILGDHIFGNRVQTIKGVRLVISPLQADQISKFQKIPPGVLKLLQVSSSSTVPNCLHLRQVRLTAFRGKSKDLLLTAEPPPHFTFACQSLGISNLPSPPTLLPYPLDSNC